MTEAALNDSLANQTPPPKAAKGPPAAAKAERKIEPLRGSNFYLRSHVVRDFAAQVPANTLPEDILNGDFWVNISGQLSPFSEIRVLWEDGSKYAQLLVLHAAGRFSRFKCLMFVELDQVDTSLQAEDAYVLVENRGPKKWCLIDAQSGEILKSMIPTQKDALVERTDLLRARAR